jgi:hypothetical protein
MGVTETSSQLSNDYGIYVLYKLCKSSLDDRGTLQERIATSCTPTVGEAP